MIPRRSHFPDAPDDLTTILGREDLALIGVASADGDPGAHTQTAEYQEWLHRKFHGSMDYLARHAALKYAPQLVLPECRSVVMVGMNYYQPTTRSSVNAEGNVARYAWGRDYHNALGKRLRRVVKTLRTRHPADQFRSFVDASPLSERFFADRAGLGFTAKNTLTISSAFGSWFFLGEILSTRTYDPTPDAGPVHGACPSGCFRCGSACPTGALFAPHRIDASRCISYLTIEHRGVIPEELRPLMGSWIFGCDLCQEVCPLNVRAVPTDAADFTAHRAGERIPLAELLLLDETGYRARFAGTPLLRPGRDAMVRNACIAAANTSSTQLLPILQPLTRDQSPIVQEHARWAIDVLTNRSSE